MRSGSAGSIPELATRPRGVNHWFGARLSTPAQVPCILRAAARAREDHVAARRSAPASPAGELALGDRGLRARLEAEPARADVWHSKGSPSSRRDGSRQRSRASPKAIETGGQRPRLPDAAGTAPARPRRPRGRGGLVRAPRRDPPGLASRPHRARERPHGSRRVRGRRTGIPRGRREATEPRRAPGTTSASRCSRSPASTRAAQAFERAGRHRTHLRARPAQPGAQ
jgi:hypothetical protein